MLRVFPLLKTRTENPYEANLFYVPLLLHFFADNVGNPYEMAKRGLVWVSQNYPQVLLGQHQKVKTIPYSRSRLYFHKHLDWRHSFPSKAMSFDYNARRRQFGNHARTMQFWSRNEGKDHFVWMPGDHGACWLLDEPVVQNPIKIVHWGLQVRSLSIVTAALALE